MHVEIADFDFEALERAAYGRNPVAWFEIWGRIEDKNVGSDPNQAPKANYLQAKVGEAIELCLKAKRPIRLILYKPRQQGCSTITVEVLYVLGRVVKMKILVIGGQASQTDNLWKILRYYGAQDKFNWGNTWDCNAERATCSNGTTWERETAGDKEAGRSGNYHAVIACVPGNTQVIGEHGTSKAIRDVVVGERIVTHLGNSTEVAALRSMPNTKGDLFEIVPYIGVPVSFTFDHAVWTKNGWVDAGDIKPGDFVSMPIRRISNTRRLIQFADSPIRKQGGGKPRPFANAEVELTEEFGYFIGYYLAEGCVCYSERRYPSKITFTHDDESRDRGYADRAIRAVNHLVTSTYESRNGTSNAIHRELRCSSLANWINMEFGSAKAGGKRIPDWVFEAGTEFCRGIVTGYLCGDGSKNGAIGGGRKYDKVNAKCVYPSILPQIRDIIASFGWGWAGIRHEVGASRYGRNCRDLWQADWNGNVGRILRGLMGLPALEVSPRKIRDGKYHIENGMVWIKVKEVRRCRCDEVWDLATSHADGSFRTLGFSCHNTEVARWPTDGAKNASDVLNSVLNCVGDGEGTVVIMESTAQGPKGEFPKTWQGAVTIEEFAAGKYGNGYIKIFAGWYRFPRCWTKLDPGETPETLRKKIADAGDSKALRIWDQLNLQPEQIKWYHEVLGKPECGGDPMKRDREYPTFEADGFKASSPSRFSLEALEILEAKALPRRDEIIWATLQLPPEEINKPDVRDRNYRLAMPMPCTRDEAEVAIMEMPIEGESYIVATDNGKGMSYTEGGDTDPNAIVVWKRGSWGERGNWRPGEVVACLVPETRWDQDVLAEVVALLSGLYGCCMVVPEANRGEMLISELRKRGVMIFERDRKKTEVEQGKETKLWGYNTTPESKRYLTENLAARIRQWNTDATGIRIWFQWIIDELRTFVRHKDGTEGALKIAGCHDDFVMALAIAVACEASATVYYRPFRAEKVRIAGLPGQDTDERGVW